MKHTALKASVIAGALSGLAIAPSMAAVVTFEGLLGGPETYWKGDVSGNGFSSAGAHFSNSYMDDPYVYWEGFAYSNSTDTTTAGYTNDYSAYTTTGGGAAGSSAYGVAYLGYTTPPTVTYSAALDMAGQGASVTNVTYPYLSMLNGDPFSKKFGGASGNDADWFKLTITGYLGGSQRASIDFYLADFRFADNSQDYIVDEWTFVDFTALGVVDELRFTLTSSDTGSFGMNTPGYFAIDNLAAVPEPSSSIALALAGTLSLTRRRRRTS